ncbi:hypothetical protein C2E23DRAFT_308935 [Lenzites betulinus]|nr:hypothetical protein C2E23DRAFT_308935 [Lenzites betulinus]
MRGARVRATNCHLNPRALIMVRLLLSSAIALHPSPSVANQSAGSSRGDGQRIAPFRNEPSPLARPPPPRAPRAMRDDRSVTPPPPRPPSPTYLALAKHVPSRVEEPSASRKLLVLDLNGTLLHRSPHNPRPKARNQLPQEDRPRDGHGNWLPRLRPVHPRGLLTDISQGRRNATTRVSTVSEQLGLPSRPYIPNIITVWF